MRARAVELRARETAGEAALWTHLKGKALGVKFRRQHPMLGFIVDFYCVEQRLVVEVDGGIHETQTDRDTARDQLMHAHGHRVLRLSEDEAVNHTDVAVARIRTALSG